MAFKSPKVILHHFSIFDISTLVKFLQSLKAPAPIRTTLLGINISERFTHELKASAPIEEIFSFSITRTSEEQLLKADAPIDFKLFGNSIIPSRQQPKNAFSSITVTLLGMITSVIFESKKQYFPILVTPFSITTFVIAVPQGELLVKVPEPGAGFVNSFGIQSPIAPFPLIVRTVPSSVQVQLPVVPLLTTALSANAFKGNTDTKIRIDTI